MRRIAGFIACSVFILFPICQAAADDNAQVRQIEDIAANSACASTNWADRGVAKKAYFKGVALVFAKALCHPEREDVRIVSSPRGEPGSAADRTDALTWYDTQFGELGMSNNTAGPETLRHAYTLLLGLGMRESSGKYCVGRDSSANFSSADTAEAGLFQTSWGAHIADPSMAGLFSAYKNDQSGCHLAEFSSGVSCSAWDARTWGDGDGADWQKLTKACPAFATEYAAVLIRKSGGKRGEFGPLRKHKAQVLKTCDSMLSQIQAVVQSNPAVCDALK